MSRPGDSPKIGGLRPEYTTYERQKCFIGHSREAEWRDDILSACAEVLPKFSLEPWYAADHFEPTKPLRDKVVEMIANARYGIYDLSSWQDSRGEWRLPRNVFIELGIAIALNRPALLVRHTSNKTLPLPACLHGVDLLEFAGEKTLIDALEKRLPQWLNVLPERDWLNRFCIFGNRVCNFREAHPRAQQWGSKTLRCHISDGLDQEHTDFQMAEREEIRGNFEEVFGRYNDLEFQYLDDLSRPDGYQFLLCSHCRVVRSTPFAVYYIRPHTPGAVFIAIGMSIALEALFEYDIPKVPLVHQEQDLPSLLRGYEVVEAATNSEVKRKLKTFMPTVMHQVRKVAWKPRPLPFVEVTIHPRTPLADLLSERALDVEVMGPEVGFPDRRSPRAAQPRLAVEVMSPEVGFLNVYASPSFDQLPVTRANNGDILESLESEQDTQAKIGREGQWLRVRAPEGIEGYSAAWYLRLRGQIIESGKAVIILSDRHELMIGKRTVYLTPKEFEVFRLLVRHTGKVLSTDAILTQAWGPEWIGEPDLVKQYVYRLRRKIEEDPDSPRYLHTVRGGGYYFDAEGLI
jgi:hypothetical protein